MLNELMQYVTPEDYLRLEAQSAQRHEYVAGGVFAMGEASPRHDLLAGTLFAALRAHLGSSPCRACPAGVKLHVARDQAYYYPDVMVSCDPRLATLPESQGLVDQPLVLVEVLSAASAGIDRREKFLVYRTIDCLREYVLIEQDKAQVEVFRRAGEAGWQRMLLERHDTLELASVDFTVAVADLYADSGI